MFVAQMNDQAEVARHARASALAAALVARTYVDKGEARVGALIALAAVPKSRSAQDPRHMPEVEAALHTP